MNVLSDTAENSPLIRTARPVLVRLVHRESGQVASEHDVSHMTGSEIENWAKYLEATTDAAGYSVEVQGLEGGAR